MSKGNTPKEDVFSVERIRSLIDLMKEYDLSEVDLKQDEQQIRLVRGAKHVVSAAPATIAPTATAAPAAIAAPVAAAADGPHIKIIKSPMVGTFYARPNPKADDFVKAGSSVREDTVVCIIEAMKVFNDIPAETSGKIVEVLVKNEEAVDFERPLFKVDTRG